MAKTSNLREFQETILSRLKEVAGKGEVASTSRLGVLVGDKKMLVSLLQVKEALPVPFVQQVPLTMPWFLGVANIRGNLYNVTDFSQYLGLGATPKSTNARILLLNTEVTTQVALQIKQLIGLRNVDELTPVEDAEEAQLEHAVFSGAKSDLDAEGDRWLEVDLENIVKESDFIQPTLA